MATYKFPEGFFWGTATASYQVEGGVKDGGRGETTWDRFCQMPGNIKHNDVGDVANDFYHKWKEDIALMKKLGHNAYRFSICWSRIFPTGKDEINEEGIKFYSDVIDELLANGIEPFVTLYHWDLPQGLQDLGGWQNPDSVKWFEDYCRVVFERYGDRVKHWITLNEPICASFYSYYEGTLAPGYHDLSAAILISYNLLRAHGAAVRLYRSMNQGGKIGITINVTPTIPASDKEEDIRAARIKDGYGNRWFLDGVLKGKFPEDIKEIYRKNNLTLPDFSKEAEMCEPLDFLGINYYFTEVIRHNADKWPFEAEQVINDVPRNGRGWAIDPQGFTDILVRIKNEYDVKKFIITENGACYFDVVSTDGQIHDPARIDYLRRHIIAIHNAMDQGVDLFGYLVWSLYDNFEWCEGRYCRFGLIYHDFDTLERTPKDSAYWFKGVAEANEVEG